MTLLARVILGFRSGVVDHDQEVTARRRRRLHLKIHKPLVLCTTSLESHDRLIEFVERDALRFCGLLRDGFDLAVSQLRVGRAVQRRAGARRSDDRYRDDGESCERSGCEVPHAV